MGTREKNGREKRERLMKRSWAGGNPFMGMVVDSSRQNGKQATAGGISCVVPWQGLDYV